MQIVSFAEAEVPDGLRAQVRDLQESAWPTGTAPDVVHDPALKPLSMLLVDGDVVVAALDILQKQLDHAGTSFLAGGLSTVVTRADRRGRGHGRQLILAARSTMLEQGLDLGIFTCDRPLRIFYESAGWQPLRGTVLIGGTPADPFPSDLPGFDKVTLAAFFTPKAQQAEPTFHKARIPLHPGTIDKLW
ncbi:GNAT family N-acetyltransferase [Kribbella sp. NPDC026611]|uniref:GNAT family N-acetyltransferase n=1 Tax=Kribbella sp. NPDC026611 TaxID=3154911 RepID=UPI0033FEA72A